jgi:hypothetical protein
MQQIIIYLPNWFFSRVLFPCENQGVIELYGTVVALILTFLFILFNNILWWNIISSRYAWMLDSDRSRAEAPTCEM